MIRKAESEAREISFEEYQLTERRCHACGIVTVGEGPLSSLSYVTSFVYLLMSMNKLMNKCERKSCLGTTDEAGQAQQFLRRKKRIVSRRTSQALNIHMCGHASPGNPNRKLSPWGCGAMATV